MITTATNASYDHHLAGWDLTYAFATGQGVQAHLIQGAYEQETRFHRRKALADYHPHTSSIASRLAGMLQAAEIVREAPVDLSAIGRQGQSMATVAAEIAETIILYGAAVIVVEADGVTVRTPIQCPRWVDGQAYTVKSQMQTSAASLSRDEEMQKVWTVYRDDSFEIYSQTEDGQGKKRDVLEASGTWHPDGVALTRPPVLRPTMHWPTALGLEVAKAHRTIYRMESRADAGELEAAASTTMLAGVGDDEDFAEELRAAMDRGDGYLPYDKDLGEHKPFALDIEAAGQLRSTLESKEERLYDVLGQTMVDNVQRTATESALSMAAGLGATLSQLADRMQSIEESVLQLYAEQQSTAQIGREQPVAVTYPTSYNQQTVGQTVDN